MFSYIIQISHREDSISKQMKYNCFNIYTSQKEDNSILTGIGGEGAMRYMLN